MKFQDGSIERQARADINKLKEIYVIDAITAERLLDILTYLYLSQGNKNQRGVQLQTEKLKNVLHTCPRIAAPTMSAQSTNIAYRI